MSTVAEIACVLTVSERTAEALITDSLALTTVLPLTLAALRGGALSWQHARIMVDEAGSLDPAGAAALEAHFLDRPHPTRPAAALPGISSRAGSGRKRAPGANATTRSASKNATSNARRTGRSGSSPTGTGWPG